MTRISKVAARAQTELDIAGAEISGLNTVISGLQHHPPLESGSSDDGWGPGTRSRQTSRPRRSPQESPRRQRPLSHRPLSPQRGPPQGARAARQWQ